ncbi:MAG: hypothetical protein H7343_13615, partial [Undibacterium sp.]|nr:hypothetical protein [Opitutaceae bacterium]
GAERLASGTFAVFAASTDQEIIGCLKTSFLPGSAPRFTYPATGNGGRVAFTRRVVETASTATSRTLRVEVQWTWQSRTSLIATPLFRTQ